MQKYKQKHISFVQKDKRNSLGQNSRGDRRIKRRNFKQDPKKNQVRNER